MIPDLKFVVETFEEYNKKIFQGSLPAPRFVMTRARTFRGKLVYRIEKHGTLRKPKDFELRVSVSFDLPVREWEDVVIHEMIHLHIAFAGIKDRSTHGPIFRNLMDSINRDHDRKIVVAVRSTPEKGASQNADKRMRAHYVCMVKFSDGHISIAPVAKTKIFQFWDMKKYFPSAVSVSWIGAIDPFFNTFPHVQSPKLYHVDLEELKEHLKGAVPLERRGNMVKPVNRRLTPDELLP